jgi:hypothetical protein
MENVSQKNLKVFGWGLVLIFCFFAAKSWAGNGPLGIVPSLAALAVFFAFLTAFNTPLLRTVYHHWMKAAGLVSKLLTFLILTALYYFLFTPLGMILRFGRNNLLEKDIKKETPSYWIPLEEKPFTQDDYHKQF